MDAKRLTRLPDWELRLTDYVSGIVGKPLVWGETDCLMLAAFGVLAVTGTDLRPPRLRYRTERGAVQALARRGYDGPVAAVDARLERIAPVFAQRGDVAAIIRDGTETCGIVTGSGLLVPTKSVPTFMPAVAASVAWKVG